MSRQSIRKLLVLYSRTNSSVTDKMEGQLGLEQLGRVDNVTAIKEQLKVHVRDS